MKVAISIGDQDLVLTQLNCNVYRFSERPEVDHVYYQSATRQFYLFGSPTLMSTLEVAGADVVFQAEPCNEDLVAYEMYLEQCFDEIFIGGAS